MLTTRLVRPGDMPMLAALMRWAAEETIATFAITPEPEDEWREKHEATRASYPWFAAEVDGVFAGVAYGRPYRPRAGYGWTVESAVYVLPEHQGRGVARRLYDRLIATLRAQGYHTMVATIAPPNEPSEALHRGVGMTEQGRIPRAGFKFGRWHDVAFWTLALQGDDRAPGELRPVATVAAADAQDRICYTPGRHGNPAPPRRRLE